MNPGPVPPPPSPSASSASEADIMLRCQDVNTWFPIRRGVMRRVVGHVRAVDGVSLEIRRGRTLGLVGESGCGKTTLVQTLLRLTRPTSGKIELRLDDQLTDITDFDRHQLAPVRRAAQLIFQNAAAAMNPRFTVLDVIAEPLRLQGESDRQVIDRRVGELLRAVGLDPSLARRRPREFSGGQQQRIGIARALALHPGLIIADEPVSALDVSVQAQILNLLRELKVAHGLTFLFIAHNLHVVRHLSDEIAVMYLGRMVESGPAESLCTSPKHPYTAQLLQSVPAAHPRMRQDEAAFGDSELPDPANPPTGCTFHPRCPFVEARCRTQAPETRLIDDRLVACHRAESIADELAGMTPLTIGGAA